MLRIYIVLALYCCYQSSFSQGITKIIPCEYVTYFTYSDNNLYTVGGTARVLPGSRLVLDASGAFNSARALATDGTYWISTDYTQAFSWSQGPTTDTTGASFNDGIALWSWSNCVIIGRADSSLWMQGNDSVGIYHPLGTRYVINQPIKLSQSGVKYQKVVIGGQGIYGLTGDGEVYFWARNSQSITPTLLTGSVGKVLDIACATYDCFIAVVQNATGDPTCGQPYCKGTSWGDWGGAFGVTYANLTSIKSVWNLPYSIKKVTETSNSMHVIDSVGDLYSPATKCNAQGEAGVGVEYVNQYTYSTFPGYGWTFVASENPIAAAPTKIHPGFKHKEIYGASFFGFYKYVTDSSGKIFFWGRNKSNVGAAGAVQNTTDNQNHPNALDEDTLIEVHPLTVSTKTTRFVAPAITITQGNQSISTTIATLTAGGNSMLQINQSSPFDTLRTTQASYLWSKISGTGGTITNPTARSTNVTGLTNGSYVYQVLMTDNYGGTDTAQAAITVTNVNYIPIPFGSRIILH